MHVYNESARQQEQWYFSTPGQVPVLFSFLSNSSIFLFFHSQFLLCILFHFSSSSFLLFHLTSTPPPPFCFSSPFLPASLHHGSFYILLSSLLVFHLLILSLFSHLSLYPIPSFSFSSTYPFSSLIHPASIYFLSLASQYTSLLFSHPSSSLPLFFLLYSFLSICSVLQSPLLLPLHSFPFFFCFFFNASPSPPYPFLHISIFLSLFILSWSTSSSSFNSPFLLFL